MKEETRMRVNSWLIHHGVTIVNVLCVYLGIIIGTHIPTLGAEASKWVMVVKSQMDTDAGMVTVATDASLVDKVRTSLLSGPDGSGFYTVKVWVDSNGKRTVIGTRYEVLSEEEVEDEQ